MRIAFNAASLLLPLTGIGQYGRHLAEGLMNARGTEVDFFYGTYWQKAVREQPVLGAQKIMPWVRNNVPYSYEIRRKIQSYKFTSHTIKKKFDLYHEPNTLPMPFDGPTVITVHDLSWIRYPETHPLKRVKDMARHFGPALEKASLIITVSEFVKTELINDFGINPDKVAAIHLGVEPLFKPRNSDETRSVLHKHDLIHAHYILALGTLEPRKNLKLTIEAYQQLPKNIRSRYPLVIVGGKGWLTSTLEPKIASLVQDGEVRQLGYVGRADLGSIVSGATALIYPSLYEGFGLPPLEAMASGVPVIASNIAAITEVVGDAGILISPSDSESASNAILRVIQDAEFRKRIVDNALNRSGLFNWKRTVSSTLSAYSKVL